MGLFTLFARPKPRFSANHNTRATLRFQELIALAADLSPSMDSGFKLPGYRVMTRLDSLKEAASFFLTQKAVASHFTQACVVGFASDAQLCKEWTPLSRLQEVVGTIRSLSRLGWGTNIAAALRLALDQIAAFRTHPGTQRRAKVLLVTDGAANAERECHDSLIDRARRERVQIFTIAIANRSDTPDSYDRDLLFRMARETRGRFNLAHGLDQLKTALASAR